MSDFAVWFLSACLGFFVGSIITNRVNAWLQRRAAKPARPSATVESVVRQMKALYSSAALEEMASRPHPFVEAMRSGAAAGVRASAESRAKHLFAIGSIETGSRPPRCIECRAPIGVSMEGVERCEACEREVGQS